MIIFASEKYLRLHLSLAARFSCLDFTWNEETKKVVKLRKNSSWQLRVNLSKILNLTYVIFQFVIILGNKSTTPEKLEALLFFSMYAIGVLLRCVGLTPGQMLNSLALLVQKYRRIYGKTKSPN